MGDGIYTALTGAMAQEHMLDVVANNVANATTSGFRGDRVVFGQMVAGAARTNGAIDPRQPPPPVADKFVRVEQNVLDATSGALRPTGNQLDVAIHGDDGFFQVRTPRGDRLTRAGMFMLKEVADQTTNVLTTYDGNFVLDEAGQLITFPRNTKDIQILPEGIVRADGLDYAKIAVRGVVDRTKLVREGTTTYTLEPGAEAPLIEFPEVRQGFLEASNVNPMSGLGQLITINRSFDALQRVIQTFQQIDQRTARDIGSRTG